MVTDGKLLDQYKLRIMYEHIRCVGQCKLCRSKSQSNAVNEVPRGGGPGRTGIIHTQCHKKEVGA